MRKWWGNVGRRGRASLTNMLFSYALQGVGFVQGFLLIPLYIHYLGVPLYGYWIATSGIINSLSFIDLGLAQPIGQRIASSMGKGDTAEASRYFWVGLSVFGTVAVAAWCLCWVGALYVPSLLKIPQSLSAVIVTAFLVSALALVLKIINDFLRAFGMAILRPAFPVLTLTIAQLLSLGLNIVLLLSGFGVLAIAISLAFAEIFCLATVGCYYAYLHMRRPFLGTFPSAVQYGAVLSFSPQVFLSQISFRITQQIDTTVVTFFFGPAATVLYTVHKKLIEFLARLMYSIWGSVLLPLSHMAGEKGASGIRPATRTIFTALFSLLVSLYACYIVADRPFVAWWIPSAAAAPLSLVVILALARLADNALNVTSELHMVMGEFKFMARFVTLASLVTLALFALLPRFFGILGIPLAMIIGSGGFAAFFALAARRRWGLLDFSTANLLLAFATAGVVLGLAAVLAAWGSNQSAQVQWLVAGVFGAIVGGCWIVMQWREVRNFRRLGKAPDPVLSGPIAP